MSILSVITITEPPALGQELPDSCPSLWLQAILDVNSQETWNLDWPIVPGDRLRRALDAAAAAGAKTYCWSILDVAVYKVDGITSSVRDVHLPRGPEKWLPDLSINMSVVPFGEAPPPMSIIPTRIPTAQRIITAGGVSNAASRSIAALLELPQDATAGRIDALNALSKQAKPTALAMSFAAAIDIAGANPDALASAVYLQDHHYEQTTPEARARRAHRAMKRGRAVWRAIGAWPWRCANEKTPDPWTAEHRPQVEHEFRRLLSESGLDPSLWVRFCDDTDA